MRVWYRKVFKKFEEGYNEEEIKVYESFIQKAKEKLSDLEDIENSIDLQNRHAETLKYEGDPIDAHKKELESLKVLIESIIEGTGDQEENARKFLSTLERTDFGGYSLVTKYKPPKFPKNFEPAGRDEYMENYARIITIMEKYIDGKNEEDIKTPESDENKENLEEKKEDEKSDTKEEVKSDPKEELSPAKNIEQDLEGENNEENKEEVKEEPDLTEDQKLEQEISQKELKIQELQEKITSISQMKDNFENPPDDLLEGNSYEESIQELMSKNSLAAKKIQTLYSKVWKSREKIDIVLSDLSVYQKEFEEILVLKKCRPAKLKITRKILETRLECYKHYLLHLQHVIDGLEKEIRKLKHQEKLI